MPAAEVRGSAKLSEAGDLLKITTSAGLTTEYFVVPVRGADPRVALPPTWELQKLEDGFPTEAVYHLWRSQHGWSCDCADATFRRERAGEMCKHLKAAKAVGLLEDR